MADAGKIVITPKGAYSSTATYEWLDEVSYDGKAYIALKTVTGITPSDDGVNWRLYLDPNDIIAGDLVPTFTEAIERSNIVSDESLSTILGKVKKWFTDLKGHAFDDTVKNLTTETTGSALDASQGKVLKDDVDEINRNLDTLGKTNLIDKSVRYDGYYANDNKYWNNIGGFYVYVIKVVPNTDIVMSGFSSDGAFCAYLNSKNVADVKQSAWNIQDNNGTHTIPSDVHYVGICCNTADISADIKAIGFVECANEINDINASLENQGLLNKFDGVVNVNQYYNSNGELVSQTGWAVTNKYKINSVVRFYCGSVDANKYGFVVWFNDSTFVGRESFNLVNNEIEFTVPSGANALAIQLNSVTLSDIKLYIDNAIDTLKDALGGLKFSVADGTLSITDGTKTWTLS